MTLSPQCLGDSVPLVMQQSVSYVTVDIGTVMYRTVSTRKECKRVQQMFVNNVGLITHRLIRDDCQYLLTSYPCATGYHTMNHYPDVVVFYTGCIPWR